MAKIVKGARFISKIVDSLPTIPSNNSDDHTAGWRETDIYIGEWFFDKGTSKAYFRSNEGIYELVTVKRIDNNGITDDKATVETKYLPGNYLGAMVYVGVLDASNGIYPPNPNPGDYWIINTSGLIGTTDYITGDFAVFTNKTKGWEKIDNSERIEQASIVVYESTFGGRTTHYYSKPGGDLQNVQVVLDDIYENLYLTPKYENNALFNNGIIVSNINNTSITPIIINGDETTSGKELLRLNGHSTNKWITFNGTIGSNAGLFIGTNDNTYNNITFSPRGVINRVLTSTVNIGWSDTTPNINNRWTIYTSNTDGYIKGLNDNNTVENVKITTNATETNFLLSKLVIGIDSSSTYSTTPLGDLQISSKDTPTILSLSKYSSTLAVNTILNKISFFNSTPNVQNIEYANIVIKTTDFINQSKIGFSVKGLNGILSEGMTLKGTDNGMFVGINQQTPLSPLHVVGNTYLDGKLTLYGPTNTHEIAGDVTFSNNLNISGKIVYNKTVDGSILEINSDVKFNWLNSSKSFNILGLGSNVDIEYNTLNANVTLNDGKLILNNSDLDITNADVNFYGGGITYNMIAQGLTLNSIASYNNVYQYTDFISDNNLVSKKFVTDYVWEHPAGLWSNGTTPDAIVAYDISKTYYVGINKEDPSFNLDVVGNARISNGLSVFNNTSINGDLTVYKSGGSSLRLSNNNLNISQNETIGIIEFYSSDSDEPKVSSFIKSIATDTTARNGALVFGVSTINNSAVEAIRISDNGNLLIDNSTSDAKLRIDNKTSYASLYITSTTIPNYNSFIISNNGNVGLNTSTTNYLLNVNGNSYFNGNIGVGVAPGTYKLNVSGNTYTTKLGVGAFDDAYNLTVSGLINTSGIFYDTNNILDFTDTTVLKTPNPISVGNTTILGSLHVNDVTIGTSAFEVNQYGYEYSNGQDAGVLITNGDENWAIGISDYQHLYFMNSYGFDGYGSVFSLDTGGGFTASGNSNNLAKLSVGGYVPTDGAGLTVHSSTSLLGFTGINCAPVLQYRLKVDGKSYFTDKIGVGIEPSSTYMLAIGGKSYFTDNIGIGSEPTLTNKLKVTGTSYFTDNVGIGMLPDSDYMLSVNGSTYTQTLSKRRNIQYISDTGNNTITIYDDNTCDDYVYCFDKVSGLNLIFNYANIDILKNREITIHIKFETMFELIEGEVIPFYIKCSNNVGETNIMDTELGGGYGSINYEDVKYIKIQLSLYDNIYDSGNNNYLQNVIWNCLIYGENDFGTIFSPGITTPGDHTHVIHDRMTDVLLYNYANITTVMNRGVYNWTRSGSTITVNWVGHGKGSNYTVSILHSTDISTLPITTYYTIEDVINDDSFTISGNDTGAITGRVVFDY